MPNLEVTIFNAAGEFVSHDVHETGECLSDAELRDAVHMIEHGTPAHVAVMLAQQHPN